MRASSPPDRDRLAGAALVIVLAFVVLLTGLIVAFFSQAISERQISNSSASQAKVSLFADGSISSIVGDLKSEIAAGSTPTPVTTTGAVPPTVTIYAPKSAANAVPQRVGKTDYPVMDAWPNLIKVSTDKEPFYTNGPTRAINLASSAPSQNGRFVSPKRWNSHYLLPKKLANADGSPNYTDPTPVDGNQVQQNFAPKWILAASDGTNPTAPGTSVVGRYAYAIYDEGGLLDLNAAGFPVPANYPGTPAPLNYGYKASEAFADLSQLTDASGNALLTPTQIDAIVGRRNFVSAAINPSTNTQTPLSGTFPAFTWASANLANYFLYGLTDGSGFLAPTQLPQLNGDPSAYDRKVLTRQEMMGLLLRGLVTSTDPATAGAQRANIQNALQYITNYTRDLNQPSYMPVSRVSSSTNPNPRPTILASASGGNNVADPGAYPTAAAQDAFSPSFLTLRAEASFLRNDGVTMAVIGEPLVKSRFALQRLAWLTYAGPITLDGKTYNSKLDSNYVTTLKNTYGFTDAYLLKGTPAIVLNYFGLTWDTTTTPATPFWRYAGHNLNGATGRILRLQEVADLKKGEPDFFQLLKGTIDPGSLGKASTNGPTADQNNSSSPLNPLNFQYQRDISLDAAIIQLAANIIDQFDLDSYPTRIVFDDGSGKQAREFRGVENLPYVYRVRTGVIRARDAIPLQTAPSLKNGSTAELYSMSGDINPATGKPYPPSSPITLLKDTGVGVLMAFPDVWNPHDENSSLGNPRPTMARLIANSATPDVIAQAGMNNPIAAGANTLTVGGAVVTINPDYGRYRGASYQLPGNGGGGEIPPGSLTPPGPVFSRVPTPNGTSSDQMSGDNSGFNNAQVISPQTSSTLTFAIPGQGAFREPTMLVKPGGPYSLTMTVTNKDLVDLQDDNGSPVFASGGVKTLVTNPLFMSPADQAAQTYTGIYLGAFPLRWIGNRWSNSDQHSAAWVYTDSFAACLGTPAGITYALQFQDASGNWVTYDEKYIDTDPSWQSVLSDALSGMSPYVMVQPAGGAFSFIDPRTSRFGSPNETNIYAGSTEWLRDPLNSSNWLDTVSCALVTERSSLSTDGVYSGFGSNYRGIPFNFAVYPVINGDWGAFTAPGWHYHNVGVQGGPGSIFFQGGMFAQNDPQFVSDARKYAGDQAWAGWTDPQFTSDPDGVVRRAMGAYVTNGSTVGQPLATASTFSGGQAVATTQSQSRPKMLNRPFRSVGELGCVFSGTPWKNLDFSSPESGDSALLDVFCVEETDPATGMVAGRLDLNTRQSMVLRAMLAGAYKDENNNFTPAPAGSIAPITQADADLFAKQLIARTTVAPKGGPNTSNGPQPLTNIGDLVGRWNGKQTITAAAGVTYSPGLNASHNIDGSKSYDGFSSDFVALYGQSPSTVSPIPAQREAVVRALSSVGNTRVWNLMIDLVAQTGRYPAGTTALGNFLVEGEQRCWVHVAIDRATGAVIDSKLEVVKE